MVWASMQKGGVQVLRSYGDAGGPPGAQPWQTQVENLVIVAGGSAGGFAEGDEGMGGGACGKDEDHTGGHDNDESGDVPENPIEKWRRGMRENRDTA